MMKYQAPKAAQPSVVTEAEVQNGSANDDVKVVADQDVPDITTAEQPTEEIVTTETAGTNNSVNVGSPVPFEPWSDVLSELSKSAPLMAAVLGGSVAYVKDDLLLIDSRNEQFFTLMRSEDPIYRTQIRNAVNTVVGRTFRLGPYKKAETEVKTEDPLQDIINKLKSLEVPGSTDET